jgi:hypothetical protein
MAYSREHISKAGDRNGSASSTTVPYPGKPSIHGFPRRDSHLSSHCSADAWCTRPWRD